jgi:surfactin synthase thioesterase subunit
MTQSRMTISRLLKISRALSRGRRSGEMSGPSLFALRFSRGVDGFLGIEVIRRKRDKFMLPDATHQPRPEKLPHSPPGFSRETMLRCFSRIPVHDSGPFRADPSMSQAPRVTIECLASRVPDSLPVRQCMKLLFFSYAGAGAQVFRQWHRFLPPEAGMCLAHLPGKGPHWGEPGFTALRPLVERIVDSLPPFLSGPVAFYGHSMGALTAFEVARETRRRFGVEPVHLFISSRRAPQIPSLRPRTFDLPDHEFIARLKSLDPGGKQLPEDPALIQLFLPLIRADFQIVETYEYVPDLPLSCPITVYGGTLDSEAPLERLSAWQAQTTGPCTVKQFPGGHFFIHDRTTNFLDTFAGDVAHLCSSVLP